MGPAQGRVRGGRDGAALSARQSRVGVVGAGGRHGGVGQQEGQRRGPEIRRGRGRRWHLRWVWGAAWSPRVRRPSLGHHPGSGPGRRPAPRAAGGTRGSGLRGSWLGMRGWPIRMAGLKAWAVVNESVGSRGASDSRKKKGKKYPGPYFKSYSLLLALVCTSCLLEERL